MFDFSKNPRNDHAYQSLLDKCAVVGILQTADQCRETENLTQDNYCKVRDDNYASENSLSTYLFFEEFGKIKGTALTTEPMVAHDNLLNRDGTFITLKSQAAPKESQQPLDQAQEVTLILKTIPEEVLLPDQIQHALSPYSEELFEDSP